MITGRRDGDRPYPLCHLHTVRIVNCLPPGCPLGEVRVGAAFDAMRDDAFAMVLKFLDASPDGAGVAGPQAYDICRKCYWHLRTHGHVVGMRQRLHDQPKQSATQRRQTAPTLQRAIDAKPKITIPRKVRRTLRKGAYSAK